MKVIDKIRTTQWFWKYRHWWDLDWPKRYLSEESLNHPHRKMLADAVLRYEGTVAEIGCGPGPNLYLLKRQYPHPLTIGTDTSRAALSYGRKWFSERNIDAVLLDPGVFEWYLNTFGIDIIFTDTTLIYFNPKQAVNFLLEMRQKAKVLIFCEWHQEEQDHLFDSHWVHNYRALLGNGVKITAIPEAYSGGNSKKYGSIIEYQEG